MNKKELSPIIDAGLALNAGGFVCFTIEKGKKAIPPWTKLKGPMSRSHFLKTALSKDEAGNFKATGIGIRLGDYADPEPCCLIAYDFDETEAAAKWINDHSDLAATLPVTKTARGNHVIARTKTLGLKSKRDSKGEFRANGNYIVAPPSKHNSGATYAWQSNQPISLSSIPIVEDLVEAGLIRSYEDISAKQCNAVHAEYRQSTAESSRVQAVIRESCTVRHSLGVVDDFSTIPIHREFNRLLDKVETIQDAVSFALPDPRVKDGHKQNNHGLWILRRAFLALKQSMTERGLWRDEAGFETQLEDCLFELWFSLTKPFHSKDKRHYRAEYDRCRVNARSALNAESALDVAAHFARITRTPQILDKYGCLEYSQLGNLTRHLQLWNGERPFFLGDNDAGDFIGKDSKTGWRWLRDLQNVPLIQLHKKGSILSRKASEFFYIHSDLHDVPEMLEECEVEEVA